MKSTRFTHGSCMNILSDAPNVHGEATCEWNIAFPSMT